MDHRKQKGKGIITHIPLFNTVSQFNHKSQKMERDRRKKEGKKGSLTSRHEQLQWINICSLSWPSNLKEGQMAISGVTSMGYPHLPD